MFVLSDWRVEEYRLSQSHTSSRGSPVSASWALDHSPAMRSSRQRFPTGASPLPWKLKPQPFNYLGDARSITNATQNDFKTFFHVALYVDPRLDMLRRCFRSFLHSVTTPLGRSDCSSFCTLVTWKTDYISCIL